MNGNAEEKTAFGYVNRGAEGTVLVPRERREKAEKRGKRQALLRVLVPVLIVVIVLTVLLAVVCNDTRLGVGQGDLDHAYGTVLANIEGITEANPRIADIAMLGAHDANMFSLSAKNGVEHTAASGALGKVFPLSKGLQYRMAVTQTVSPYDLLMQGARFLQFKFSLEEDGWRAAHTVLGRQLEEDILDVLRFLDEHPGEVVLLLFQCGNSEEDNTDCPQFNDWLAGIKYNDRTLYDYADTYIAEGDSAPPDIAGLRYNDVTVSGEKAGLVMLQRFKELYGTNGYTRYFYDMDASAMHRWHSRMGSDILIEEIDSYADELLNIRAHRIGLRVNQTQAAFSAETLGDILRGLGAGSLLKFAEKYNVALLDSENFGIWLRAMPIFQVDFANSSEGDFNRRVNAAIRERNEEIVEVLMREGATDDDIYAPGD